MIWMENIEMKLFSCEAPSQVLQLQESQFNDPDPTPGPVQPSLEHPLVPLNEVVSESVDQQHPRNTKEAPASYKMESKGAQPPLMKMESVAIEMKVFPYTGRTEKDMADRRSRTSPTPGTSTPEAPRSSPPPKLTWRRSVPERRGLVVKDIVCLPSRDPQGLELSPCVPRGGERAELEALGLVTRMSIDESWSSQEMESRLAALFKRRFSSKPTFTYLKCLQSSRVLFVPDTPPQSGWTGKQVLKITGHGPLYLLCHHDYAETNSNDVVDGNPSFKRHVWKAVKMVYMMLTLGMNLGYNPVYLPRLLKRLDSIISHLTEGVNSCVGLWDVTKDHSVYVQPIMTAEPVSLSPSRSSRSP